MGNFVSDFFGGITESTQAQIAKGQASGDSYGTQAGQAFFSLAKEYFKSGNVKDAAIARVRENPTVQEEIAKEKTAYIQNLIRNPQTWLIAGVVILVIGWAGFALGKR